MERELAALIAGDLPVAEEWITDDELATRPELVKTMSVAPPACACFALGQARRRPTADLQPCGGTHAARTGEIGPVRLGKIEKRGAQPPHCASSVPSLSNAASA